MGEFVAFNTYMILLIWPIIAVGWVINIFQRGTASVKRIDELLHAEPAIDDRSADLSFGPETVLKGEIEFRHLNFSYGDTPVLNDISLLVPAGSSLAIVGPTGCGKSTLVNLLSRLYEAPEGTLFIDGRPVRDYPLAVLRRNISMVPQKHSCSAKPSAKILPSARPSPAPKNCSLHLKPRTFERSLRNFLMAFKPW